MDIRPDDEDEIIAEVRRNRKAYCARFGNDWDLIHEHLKRLDAENPDNVVSFSRGPLMKMCRQRPSDRDVPRPTRRG